MPNGEHPVEMLTLRAHIEQAVRLAKRAGVRTVLEMYEVVDEFWATETGEPPAEPKGARR